MGKAQKHRVAVNGLNTPLRISSGIHPEKEEGKKRKNILCCLLLDDVKTPNAQLQAPADSQPVICLGLTRDIRLCPSKGFLLHAFGKTGAHFKDSIVLVSCAMREKSLVNVSTCRIIEGIKISTNLNNHIELTWGSMQLTRKDFDHREATRDAICSIYLKETIEGMEHD